MHFFGKPEAQGGRPSAAATPLGWRLPAIRPSTGSTDLTPIVLAAVGGTDDHIAVLVLVLISSSTSQ